MCTLTILRNLNSCIVTMNRDERIARHESGRLQEENHHSTTLIYPLDDKELGTWVAANSHGMVGCLLNRYQSSHAEDKISRGKLIPLALQNNNIDEAAQSILALDLNEYNPFDLFLIDTKRTLHLQWGGDSNNADFVNEAELVSDKEFIEIETSEFMFSSSSLKTEEVLSYRKVQFDHWLQNFKSEKTTNQLVSQSILKSFHSKQDVRYKTHAVLMEREHSHTKSISQIEIGTDEVRVDYYPKVLLSGLHTPVIKVLNLS